MGVRRCRRDSLTAEAAERNAGPRCHVSGVRPVEIHLESGAQRLAALEDGDRLNDMGEQAPLHRRVEFPAHDVNVFILLFFEFGPSDVILIAQGPDGETG